MTIHEANRLLNSDEVDRDKLLQCFEDLCKEYGYVQKISNTNLWDLELSKKVLAEMQILIEKLKEKLK